MLPETSWDLLETFRTLPERFGSAVEAGKVLRDGFLKTLET